ncbi:sulfite exporter TauE/SafE family protein [Pleionea sp. CnH1-48]|uniref:sulfite exporter TauE/SafE family protein n=1 Tax=Pleionea sp. CnH1-48 TaxID=2954494 RepID=UPI002098191F|nr:sulfite exporter TauE/SafE family protein [Pleionea sp. CnH1-48]MCO7226879.1 sulfite exporter TauE/SafE family protein [Pleionea sp. CnH1-48]
MLSFVMVGCAALLTAILTMFSGFGLGTLLMPVFALFFPLPVAVASTALVHGANNLFKVSLMHRDADKAVVLRFGLTAVAAAWCGAWILSQLAHWTLDIRWQWFAVDFVTTPLNITLGLLILAFTAIDHWPTLKKKQLAPRWLPVGGIISGFFGGLSGHQGAFRSMFLLSYGLTPKTFVATQAVLATMVDTTRLLVYGTLLLTVDATDSIGAIDWPHILVATVCAFIGTLTARKYLEKIKIAFVRRLTTFMLVLVAVGLILGIL